MSAAPCVWVVLRTEESTLGSPEQYTTVVEAVVNDDPAVAQAKATARVAELNGGITPVPHEVYRTVYAAERVPTVNGISHLED